MQVCHQKQVLFTGEQIVYRRELAGDADCSANRVRLQCQVVASNAHLATISTDKRGQDLHRRGLACTIRAKQREDRSRCYVEVDTVEYHVVAERFAQTPYFNHHGVTSMCYNTNH